MTAQVWIDGQPGTCVPTIDRGLLYGDGLFETIRIDHGQLQLWPEHRRRLLNGCRHLGLADIADRPDTQLAAVMDVCIQPEANHSGVLKIIVTRGAGGRGYQPPADVNPSIIIQLHPLPELVSERATEGVNVMLCRHPLSINASLAGLKTLNRLDQVMASRELTACSPAMNIQEGLMTDGHGLLIEGTRSNLFLVIDGQLCTPALTRTGIAGVMREWLLEQCRSEQIPVQVRDIEISELDIATELFICNSVLGVWPVNRSYSGPTESASFTRYNQRGRALLMQQCLQRLLRF